MGIGPGGYGSSLKAITSAFCFSLHHATNPVEQPTGTIELLVELGRPTEEMQMLAWNQRLRKLEAFNAMPLCTHIFAFTHRIVNRAVISSSRWLAPFEAWSLHPAMLGWIHGLGCPSSTAWLLVRLRMNVLMHISLHVRILVIVNPCFSQGHNTETNLWEKNKPKQNTLSW